MVLIGMSAFKRCGKDTVADYLVENYGFHKLSFARALKDSCKILFGFDDDDFEKNKEKEHPYWKVSPRKIMQFMGTEMFREKLQECIPWIKENFWIEKVKQSYLDLQNKYGTSVNVVITDCRFLNEEEAIRNLGGLIIGITREGYMTPDLHSSEMELIKIKKDYIIENNSTIEYLYKNINSIYEEIKFDMV
jgi:hypothetical protein